MKKSQASAKASPKPMTPSGGAAPKKRSKRASTVSTVPHAPQHPTSIRLRNRGRPSDRTSDRTVETRAGRFNFGRAFATLLGAFALVAVVVIGAQNAPQWLGSLGGDNTTASGATSNISGLAATAANRIGIVSGHRGNDSGAVCQDGLTEAQVNFDHATRTASFLRAEGYEVDILDEFDKRLTNYRALVLLSIHADSCAYINDLTTGFKVARALESRVPDIEDDLVKCLTSRYKQATGLRFHANTVTFDMTKYHAFYEIDPNTPAAIIETGFMYLDRPLLTRQPERVAQGITDGLLCFLRKETP